MEVTKQSLPQSIQDKRLGKKKLFEPGRIKGHNFKCYQTFKHHLWLAQILSANGVIKT